MIDEEIYEEEEEFFNEMNDNNDKELVSLNPFYIFFHQAKF